MRRILLCFVSLVSIGWLLTVYSCSPESVNDTAEFEFDHLVFFVTDSTLENNLKDIFTFGEKLTTQHKHQGTEGHYFIFYNTFIEFLYLNDSNAARNNEQLFKSQYTKRWKNEPFICPLGIGLTMNPFDTSKSSFPFSAYHSLDSPKEEYYLMSAFNKNQEQPLLYISQPERAYHKIEQINELDSLLEEPVRSDFKNYLTHPSEIKRLTQTIITLPNDVSGKNVELLEHLNGIKIKHGNKFEITLVFDNAVQNKSISIPGNFGLTIHY